MGVRPLIYLIPALGFASCTVAEPDPTYGEVDQAIRCDEEFCGTNSPLISHYGAWEFSVSGARNTAGFVVLGLAKGTQFYKLEVRDSRIRGKDRLGTPVLEGRNLVGARIYLDRGGKQSAIVITDVGMIDEVVAPSNPPGPPNTLETYVLDWAGVTSGQLRGPLGAGDSVESEPVLGVPTEVCPPPKWTLGDPAARLEWDESAGLSPYHSLVFEGDRFDPEALEVSPTPEDDWFNIGCGAHTLAKLRLTRHTIHTAPWASVQAALKMLSADYCGSGRAFTYSGEPLVWRDDVPGMSFLHLHPTNELEARWDENGATCLYSPRLLRTTNPAAATAFPDLWGAIENECLAIPPPKAPKVLTKCAEPDPSLPEGKERITSANYD